MNDFSQNFYPISIENENRGPLKITSAHLYAPNGVLVRRATPIKCIGVVRRVEKFATLMFNSNKK